MLPLFLLFSFPLFSLFTLYLLLFSILYSAFFFSSIPLTRLAELRRSGFIPILLIRYSSYSFLFFSPSISPYYLSLSTYYFIS